MAYLSPEDTKTIRNKIKSHFGKDYKFSVTNEHYTSIAVCLVSSPICFEKGYYQVNNYHIQSTMKDNPEMAKLMETLLTIITGVKSHYDRNAGDPTADYGDSTYFINLSIGKWNNPYQWTHPVKKVA
jgi:hypothetical protein